MAIDHQAYSRIVGQASKIQTDMGAAVDIVGRVRRLSAPHREVVLRNLREASVTAALVYELVGVAREQRRADPHDSKRWAAVAVELADGLRGPLATDARMGALIELGNGLRITGDLSAARKTLDVANDLVADCSGDPLLLIELASVRASLAVQMEDLIGAACALDVALGVAAEVGDRDALVRLLVQIGIVCEHARDPSTGLRALEEAAGLVDDRTPDVLRLTIVHSIVRLYKISGQPQRAIQLMRHAGPIWTAYGTPLDRARAQWVYGQCLLDAGHADDACAALLDAKTRIARSSGSNIEGGLVALDHARALCSAGRFGVAQEEVADAAAALRGHGLSVAMKECLSVWTAVRGPEVLAMVEVICREAHRRLCAHGAPSGY